MIPGNAAPPQPDQQPTHASSNGSASAATASAAAEAAAPLQAVDLSKVPDVVQWGHTPQGSRGLKPVDKTIHHIEAASGRRLNGDQRHNLKQAMLSFSRRRDEASMMWGILFFLAGQPLAASPAAYHPRPCACVGLGFGTWLFTRMRHVLCSAATNCGCTEHGAFLMLPVCFHDVTVPLHTWPFKVRESKRASAAGSTRPRAIDSAMFKLIGKPGKIRAALEDGSLDRRQ